MLTMHLRDLQGIYTRSVEVDSMGPIPRFSTQIAPPPLAGTEVAQWNGNGWDLLPDRPQPTQEEAAARRADAVAARWEFIKAERDGERAQGGVLVDSGWFHTDTDSRIKWLGLKDTARDMLAAGALSDAVIVIDGEVVMWKTMTGDFVAVTVQMALDVVEATKVLDKQLFKRAEQHYTAMMASDEPSSYDYSADWPDRFVDLNSSGAA